MNALLIPTFLTVIAFMGSSSPGLFMETLSKASEEDATAIMTILSKYLPAVPAVPVVTVSEMPAAAASALAQKCPTFVQKVLVDDGSMT